MSNAPRWIKDLANDLISDPKPTRYQAIVEMIERHAPKCAAAHPDHTLLASAFRSGILRWEPSTNELCCGGLRYVTALDIYGVPILHAALRSAILNAHRRKLTLCQEVRA